MERKPSLGPTDTEQRPTLGVIDALSGGFDIIVRRPWVLSIPVVLDLFLWLGPRLSAPALYQQFEPALRQMVSDATATDTRFAVLELGKTLENFFTQFNLLSWLNAGWLGVPVVNGGLDATAPLATGSAPLNIPIASFDVYLLVVIAAVVLGLFLCGLFWSMLASAVRGERAQPARWMKAGYHMWLQLLLLALVLLGLFLMSIVPLSMAIMVVGAFSTALASLIPAFFLVAVLWLFFYGAFTLPGLALYAWSFGRALRLSILVVRLNFLPTLTLVMIVLAVHLGMGLIWDSIPANSWLRLIGILGHAATSTGVFLAFLLYFQNRSQILFERFHWPLPDQALTTNR